MSRSALVDDLKFQSTPAITGGRCIWYSGTAGLPPCFNPRPPLLAGDAQVFVRGGVDGVVSIHARHYWRAMLPAPGRWPGRCERFNPRPPLLAGDAGVAVDHAVFPDVSIHARHYWRAMLSKDNGSGAIALFQSTPAITGGRCSFSRRHRRHSTEFQSTPAITGGRCASNRAQDRVMRCFNPRPPLLAGDAIFGKVFC